MRLTIVWVVTSKGAPATGVTFIWRRTTGFIFNSGAGIRHHDHICSRIQAVLSQPLLLLQAIQGCLALVHGAVHIVNKILAHEGFCQPTGNPAVHGFLGIIQGLLWVFFYFLPKIEHTISFMNG